MERLAYLFLVFDNVFILLLKETKVIGIKQQNTIKLSSLTSFVYSLL